MVTLSLNWDNCIYTTTTPDQLQNHNFGTSVTLVCFIMAVLAI